MEDLLKQMGTRIYERRKQRRWTQEKLAEESGLTPQTISTAELGKKALRPENIIKICDALEISADYLLSGRVAKGDITGISDKVVHLTSKQYECLAEIIDNFLAAVLDRQHDNGEP